MKRASFLIRATAAGSALLVRAMPAASAAADTTALNAWVRVDTDNLVTIMVSQAEMGQGIQTTFPAAIADELDADWNHVRLEPAGINPAYNNPHYPWQFTGDAESMRTFFPVIRAMGASARDALVRAAAARWNVDPATCTTSKSRITHAASGRTLTYGSVATAAALLAPDPKPRLKTPAEWTLLRRSLPRTDLRAKITGAKIFGIDVSLPGMLHAAVMTAPTIDGELVSYEFAAVAKHPGVIMAVRIPRGVAIVATSYWRARKALASLPVTWRSGPAATLSDASLTATYRTALDGDAWATVLDQNDARGALASARQSGATVVSAEYSSAWQAHATMEPMNCTAQVDASGATLWAPTQGQTMCALKVSEALGIPQANVRVNRTFLGGGFGRRLIADYAVQAALVARAAGKPVKLIWSREEDFHRDSYRPRFVQTMSAALDSAGAPIAVEQRVVAPTIISPVIVGLPKPFTFPALDPLCLEALSKDDFPYVVLARRLDFHLLDVPVPTMVWRTTGAGPNVFALESFVDELAFAARLDPYRYRKMLLGSGPFAARGNAVLDLLADKARLAELRPRGRGVGIAFSFCFGTYIAQAIDVTLTGDVLDIHHVTSVLDGGYVLDPTITRANIEGGVNWGLTQALTSEITFANGAAQQTNFDSFKILTLPEAPPMSLFTIDSGGPLGGLGEVGPVATAPALANAIFAASGRRLRSLPLAKHGVRTRYAQKFTAGSNV